MNNPKPPIDDTGMWREFFLAALAGAANAEMPVEEIVSRADEIALAALKQQRKHKNEENDRFKEWDREQKYQAKVKATLAEAAAAREERKARALAGDDGAFNR